MMTDVDEIEDMEEEDVVTGPDHQMVDPDDVEGTDIREEEVEGTEGVEYVKKTDDDEGPKKLEDQKIEDILAKLKD